MMFNSYLLVNMFGFTWRLIFVFWDSVVHWLMRNDLWTDHEQTTPSAPRSNELELQARNDDDVMTFVIPPAPLYHTHMVAYQSSENGNTESVEIKVDDTQNK